MLSFFGGIGGSGSPFPKNTGVCFANFNYHLSSTVHSYKHNAEYRKFALAALRGLGIGKRSFESDITEESKSLQSQLNALEGQSCNPRIYLKNTTSNVLFKSLFGKRHEYDDDKFSYFIELNNRLMELMGAGAWSMMLPRYFPNKETKEMFKITEDIGLFLDKLLAEHRENFDAENPFDFIDLYLKEIEDNPPPDDPFSYLTESKMKGALMSLFAAGGDTIGTSLEWCCVYMMAYPDIQKKIQAEIDVVVGRNRLPQMSDVKNLPYTNAALLEIRRHVTLVPLGDFKASNEETSLCGYRISTSATIITNIYAVMQDPITFPEPDQYKPERFIDENGEHVEKEELRLFNLELIGFLNTGDTAFNNAYHM